MKIHLLSAYLTGQICLRHPIDLEALLLDARFRLEGEDSLKRPLECLKLQDDIPLASMSFLIPAAFGGVSQMEIARIRGLHTRTRGEQIHVTKNMPRALTFVDTMSPYRSELAKYPQLTGVDRLCWYFTGDAERVLDLAREIDWLGPMRNAGFGEVREWTLEEADASLTTPWIDRGHLLRRLPATTTAPIHEERRPAPEHAPLRPPYWAKDNCQFVLIPNIAAMIDYGRIALQSNVAEKTDEVVYYG